MHSLSRIHRSLHNVPIDDSDVIFFVERYLRQIHKFGNTVWLQASLLLCCCLMNGVGVTQLSCLEQREPLWQQSSLQNKFNNWSKDNRSVVSWTEF